VSRDKQSGPATRRLIRQSITTQLQCAPTDNDVRRDAPAAKHCNSFSFPLCPSPCDYKRERWATDTKVRPSKDQTPFPGTLGSTPSPDKLVTPTTSTPNSGTRQHHTGRRYYSSEARTSLNPVVSCANHPSPTHDRYKFTVGGR
jgi:hypothetical protein